MDDDQNANLAKRNFLFDGFNNIAIRKVVKQEYVRYNIRELICKELSHKYQYIWFTKADISCDVTKIKERILKAKKTNVDLICFADVKECQSSSNITTEIQYPDFFKDWSIELAAGRGIVLSQRMAKRIAEYNGPEKQAKDFWLLRNIAAYCEHQIPRIDCCEDRYIQPYGPREYGTDLDESCFVEHWLTAWPRAVSSLPAVNRELKRKIKYMDQYRINPFIIHLIILDRATRDTDYNSLIKHVDLLKEISRKQLWKIRLAVRIPKFFTQIYAKFRYSKWMEALEKSYRFMFVSHIK